MPSEGAPWGALFWCSCLCSLPTWIGQTLPAGSRRLPQGTRQPVKAKPFGRPERHGAALTACHPAPFCLERGQWAGGLLLALWRSGVLAGRLQVRTFKKRMRRDVSFPLKLRSDLEWITAWLRLINLAALFVAFPKGRSPLSLLPAQATLQRPWGYLTFLFPSLSFRSTSRSCRPQASPAVMS